MNSRYGLEALFDNYFNVWTVSYGSPSLVICVCARSACDRKAAFLTVTVPFPRRPEHPAVLAWVC